MNNEISLVDEIDQEIENMERAADRNYLDKCKDQMTIKAILLAAKSVAQLNENFERVFEDDTLNVWIRENY
jgi:hypothetical protein